MKKIIYVIIIILLICGIGGAAIYSAMDNDNQEVKNVSLVEDSTGVSVEDLIEHDKAAMDTIFHDYIFWECRVVLNKPFNESESFNPYQVTNVFQKNTENCRDIITTVYMFIHNINDGSTIVEVHDNAFITDDVELYNDSITVTFEKAFELLKSSNFAPSKSEYITLRHGFGRYACNPFYTIGNEYTGHLWVDAKTGIVTDKDPANTKK